MDIIRLLRAECEDAEFFQSLGRLFTEQQLFELAKEVFETSLELDPCDALTHVYLGNWYYRHHQLEAALECFEYANQLMPDLPMPYWCIADVFEKQHRFDEAKAFHRKAAAANPKDKQARRLYRKFRERRREL